MALVLGATTLWRIAPSEPLPADVPFEALHLPTVVNTPGTWSDDEGPTGPLAALGLAIRTEPRDVVTASWAPDDTAFAYVGRPGGRSRAPWRLYAGRTMDEARDHALPLPAGMHPSQLLGWRDDRHVVVGHFRTAVHVVDVVSGDVEELDLAGYGEPMNAPLLATALWRNPLVEPAEPDGTTDPRRPFRWGGGALLALLAGASLLRRRRAHA